jgi:hypothetical protein
MTSQDLFGHFWKPPRNLGEKHFWRPRRSGYEELVQWDTSNHDWLESRGGGLPGALDRQCEQPPAGDGSCYTTGRGRTSACCGSTRKTTGIPAYSPQAKGRVERSVGTDQDRLVKHLRLAKVKSLRDAGKFLEEEYWPEWNERLLDLHRPLTPQIDLASALSHVEQCVISKRLHVLVCGAEIDRTDRREGTDEGKEPANSILNGALRAPFEGVYTEVSECGVKAPAAPEPSAKPACRDHNRGGKSDWMVGFFERPGPALWQAVEMANARK